MILFFGPPGSGKSVQGQLLVERNKWQWLSTGDLFRNSNDSEVLKQLASGDLIDDELTNKVLTKALNSTDNNTRVVLDGYPRNLDQVDWLKNNLPKYDRKISCVILFEVPRAELVSRLSARGRAEDTVDVINHRLDVYDTKTRPVIDFYRKNGVPVHVVDGSGEVQEIHERIQAQVVECLARE